MWPTETRSREQLLAVYTEACNYPGVLDEQRVETELARYLKTLGIKKKVCRLPLNWELSDHPDLLAYVIEVLKDFVKRTGRTLSDALDALAALDALDARDARDALHALDALDARDALDALHALDARAALDALDARAALDALDGQTGALRRFASWCVHLSSWWWWHSDMSAFACYYPGAVQLDKGAVMSWSKPIFEAYLAGAWMIHWTEQTLFWVAKPKLYREPAPNFPGGRMHNASGPALESDVENLYFWHGVMVPAFAVTKPEWITLKHIQEESNAEVRRVLIERYGLSRYLLDSGAKRIAEDEFGELYRIEIEGDEPLVMVKVMNSTPEPDGSIKPYFLRVHPQLCPMRSDGTTGDPQKTTALNAVASTFGLTGSEYLDRLVAQS